MKKNRRRNKNDKNEQNNKRGKEINFKKTCFVFLPSFYVTDEFNPSKWPKCKLRAIFKFLTL